MSEDKHFRRTLVLGLVISALLIGVGFWQSITMGIVCLVGCGALLAIFCLYTHNQTREIRRLSDYLTTLVNGTEPLLVPANNQEGELTKKRASMVCEKSLAYCPFWRITFTKPPASCKPRRS